MTSAIVFAYHNVGVRCLSVLLDRGIRVPLVLTHLDDPKEEIWFESVAELAQRYGISVITPLDPNTSEVVEQVKSLQPDFLFSFYYRSLLKPEILNLAKRGALNMHGSLLPKYRGRAPVNWAIIKGEVETGATLHYMTEKPDSGDIVDQQAVPILSNDTAVEVFNKVTVAAELVLNRNITALVEDKVNRRPQDFMKSSYYGGRRPKDGRINWHADAITIHNLVRGVASPYPGALTTLENVPARVLKTVLLNGESGKKQRSSMPGLYVQDNNFFADCGDGGVIRILKFELDGKMLSPRDFLKLYGDKKVDLE